MTEEQYDRATSIKFKIKEYKSLIDAIDLSGDFDIHFHYANDGVNREFRLSYLNSEIDTQNIKRMFRQYAELRLEETQKEFDEL